MAEAKIVRKDPEIILHLTEAEFRNMFGRYNNWSGLVYNVEWTDDTYAVWRALSDINDELESDNE